MSNTNQTYKALLSHITRCGNIREPTGVTQVKSLEMVGYQTRWRIDEPLVTLSTRKLGYRFAAAEAEWILEGRDDVKSIQKFAPGIERFSDDGISFFGAYGPKVFAQVPYVVDTLTMDPQSRQAVINIWRERPEPSKDIPCTLSLQFLLSKASKAHAFLPLMAKQNLKASPEGALYYLDVISTMRSNDAWLGTPYDVFNFSMIGIFVTVWLRRSGLTGLNIQPGVLYHTAGSHHLYYNDVGKATIICITDDLETDFAPDRLAIYDIKEPTDLCDQLHLVSMGESSRLFPNMSSFIRRKIGATN